MRRKKVMMYHNMHSKLENILITHQDVTYLDVIINLKNDKACGLDLINHTLLKESIHVLSFPLTDLFNRPSYKWYKLPPCMAGNVLG